MPVPAGSATRLDLPADDDHDLIALYQQTLDGIPVYNGVSGYLAVHQYAMREMLRAHDPRILQAMTSTGPLGVVIDHAADVDGQYRRFVQSYPGATLRETHDSWSSYQLPAGSAPVVPDEQGTPVRIASLNVFPSPPHATRATDGDLKTRWSGGLQQSAADFTIELAEPGHVGQLVTDLGEFWTDFPVRLRVDVSSDGGRWETVYLADTMLQAY